MHKFNNILNVKKHNRNFSNKILAVLTLLTQLMAVIFRLTSISENLDDSLFVQLEKTVYNDMVTADHRS
jgi:hypothetical protein